MRKIHGKWDPFKIVAFIISLIDLFYYQICGSAME